MEVQKNKKIVCLPAFVYEKIAAGEVIERPASVVKELVENALDAKADAVRIELESGGTQLIRITDNGYGMDPDDLVLSVQQHATSKLEKLEDLQSICSFGFRGEALASVCAVADVILTSSVGPHLAHKIEVKEGRVQAPPVVVTKAAFLHKPHGTSIEVRGLFSHYPARLKFLKSSSVEVSHVKEWLLRMSACYPGVSFDLISNQKQIVHLPACTPEQRIRDIFEEQELAICALEKTFGKDFSVQIFWIKNSSYSSSKKIIQVVNKRALKDRLLHQAILNGVKQSIMPGQYPGLALFIQINSDLIDVNVHPAKTEVRFLEPSSVFAAIQSCVQEVLRSSFQSPFSQKDLSKSPIEQEPALPLEQKPSFVFDQGKKDDFVLEKKPSFRALQDFEHHWPATVEPVSPPVRLQQLHQVQEDKENAVFCIYIGVVFATYLLFQKENVFFLVDQHAAHERIQFEKNHHSHQNSQKLLQEERFDVADASLLKKRLFWFQTARFDVHFDESQSQIVFLGVPACWQNNQIRIRLKNCLERVLDEQTLEISQVGLDYWVFEEDAMRACKESIRAHQILAPFQAEALFRDLFLTRHPGNCPHGRPTYIEISQNQVEGWFRRQNARSELSW